MKALFSNALNYSANPTGTVGKFFAMKQGPYQRMLELYIAAACSGVMNALKVIP